MLARKRNKPRHSLGTGKKNGGKERKWRKNWLQLPRDKEQNGKEKNMREVMTHKDTEVQKQE